MMVLIDIPKQTTPVSETVILEGEGKRMILVGALRAAWLSFLILVTRRTDMTIY